MNSVPKKIIELAIKEAEKVAFKFRVGAVIYHRARYVVGRGYNKPHKTHPKSFHPYKTIHAEFDAILNLGSYESGIWELDGASIYVHRLKKDGSPGLAKPCEACATMLAWAGIKNVYYSEG